MEEIIFSQLLSNDSFARAVLPYIKEEYFSTQEEKAFFKIYTRFFKKYNKIPSTTAMLIEIEHLKSSAEIYKSLKEIVDKTTVFEETLPYLIEKTEEFCKERALFNALREAVLIVDGQSKDKDKGCIPTLLQDALGVCFDTSVGHSYIDDVEERYDYYHSTVARVKTGLSTLDKITRGGFPRKTLNVILAPPHGGKSLVLVNVAVGAMNAGHNVLYISLEMSEEEISKRFDVNMMDVDFDTLDVLPKTTFMSKFANITKQSRGKLVVKEYPTGVGTAAHFRLLLSELRTKQNFVPDLIVVDYLNICGSEHYKLGANQNSYTVVGSVGKELRALAKECDASVVTATQTNRTGVGNSEVDMTAVSDSAGTSMISDFMIAIINTDELKQMKQLLFKQIKNRYDGISSPEKFILGVDYSKMKLYEIGNSGVPVTPPTATSKKIDSLNKKAAGINDLDILHTIKPVRASFSDFNFDE